MACHGDSTINIILVIIIIIIIITRLTTLTLTVCLSSVYFHAKRRLGYLLT